jgi:predicted membrane-bound mannosyltransferase
MNGSQMRSFLRTWGVFALVSALFASTRLWRLTEHSLRPDEIFSLQTARQDWIGLIHAAVRDVVHPPLFYALLKSWIAVGGDSEYWLRLLPVLIAALTPLPFLLLGRRLGIGWNAINLGVLLMAVNAYLVYFARDLRMYSLVPLLTVCSLWLMFRYKDGAPDDRKRWLPLFAVNVLLVYSHYFGWLIVAGEALILCLDDRRRVRAVLLSCAALLLLFIPWAALVTRASLARGGLESSIGSFAPTDARRPGRLLRPADRKARFERAHRAWYRAPPLRRCCVSPCAWPGVGRRPIRRTARRWHSGRSRCSRRCRSSSSSC